MTTTEEAMTNPSPAALQQMILSCDEKHSDAHKRVRDEMSYLKDQIDRGLQSVRGELGLHQKEMATYVATPIDVTKIVLSTKIVFGIIIVVLSIYGAIWAATYGLSSDIRDILTRIEAQKVATENATKFQDERADTIKTAIEDMKRRQESQATELQSLKEAVLKGKIPSNR